MYKVVQQLLRNSKQNLSKCQYLTRKINFNQTIQSKFSSNNKNKENINNNEDLQNNKSNKIQNKSNQEDQYFENISSKDEYYSIDFEKESFEGIIDSDKMRRSNVDIDEADKLEDSLDYIENQEKDNQYDQSYENKQQNKRQEEKSGIDVSKLNEFDMIYYNFFEKYKEKQLLNVLSKGDFKELGLEFNKLIQELRQKDQNQIYEIIKQPQLLFFRLYSDWLFIMNSKKYQIQEEVNSENNLKYFEELMLTFRCPLQSQFSKEYFSCIHNYASKVFEKNQNEFLIPILKKNLQNIQIIELVRFALLYQKEQDLLKQIITEILIKIPKATILEFSFIQELYKIPEVKKNSVFTDQFLKYYTPYWPKMGVNQVYSIIKVLNNFKEVDFPKYFHFYEEEVVRRNFKYFSLKQIQNLLKFFQDQQIKSKTMHIKDITHELDIRRVQLKIKQGLFYVESQMKHGASPKISRHILETFKQYFKIQSDIQFFKQSYCLPKSQVQSIISNLHQKNPKYEQYRSTILEYTIPNFELYTSLLQYLGIKEQQIIHNMNNQYLAKYHSLNLPLESEIRIFRNFTLLAIKYPFIKELQQKFLDNIDNYEFNNYYKSGLAFELICLCSLYEPNTDLVNQVEKQLVEHFITEKDTYKYDKYLDLIIQLPQNTFKEFISKLLQKSDASFFKQNFYKNVYILTKQGKIDPNIIVSNSKFLNFFKNSQKHFYNTIKNQSQQDVLTNSEQDLYLSLTCIAQKYFSDKNLKIIAKHHFVENYKVTFLIQNNDKTLHLDLFPKQATFINEENTLIPQFQRKYLFLKSQINYDYILQQEFCSQDRDELIKKLLSKYFN